MGQRNEWQQSSLDKRDAKHGGEVKELGNKRTHPKNTKLWCKGKTDREHVWLREIVTGPWTIQDKVTENVCQTCGKRDWKSRTYDSSTWSEWFSSRVKL